MPNTASCPCGVKVRLPEQPVEGALRCPKCKRQFLMTADLQAIFSEPAPADGSPATCPICQSPIAAGEVQCVCPSCQQVHHQECWTEIGGCSTYGCQQMPVPSKESVTGPPLTAWGDTKTCPVCGEQIKSIALRCRYCRADFNSADPLTIKDIHKESKKKEAQKSLQIAAWVLFFVSLLLGFFMAPLLLIIDGIWMIMNRHKLRAAGPLYLVLAYSATALSALYSILLGFFFLFGR